MRRSSLALLLFGALASSQASPLLVAVDLPDEDIREIWVRSGHPTYAYAEPTAFAEVPAADLPRLKARGMAVRVVDRAPWTRRYYLGTLAEALRGSFRGEILWERDGTVLVAVTDDAMPALRSLPTRLQPLERRALEQGFWRRFAAPAVPLRALPWDPVVQAAVDAVHTDSLTSYIQRLQDFGSRLTLEDSSLAASQWLADTFGSWGYEVRFDSFYIPQPVYGNWPGIGWERNVVAHKSGTGNSAARLVIGGHFDSIVWSDTALARIDAPGADDNATGTAGAMEAARVLRDLPMKRDVDFAGWAAEEIGLIGSSIYALQAYYQGDLIEGMINMDMIGYMDDSRLDCIIQYIASHDFWFADLYRQAASTYVPELTVTPTISSGGSDWYPFAALGFPAVGAAEQARSHFNPHYHSITDRIETLSPQLYTAITRASVATLATLAICPAMVEDVWVQDMGDGATLTVHWSASAESDIVGYRLWWGSASQVYTDSTCVPGPGTTAHMIGDLAPDTPYYLVVRAEDTGGHVSFRATEVMAVPRVIPQAPTGVAATPIPEGIRVDWSPNTEADIAGYRVLRRVNEGGYEVAAAFLADTTFSDSGLSGAHRYYYRIEAMDTEGNASEASDDAYGRPLTLDQGILVVDETRNHTNPSDSLQDEFYRTILEGFTTTDYEYGSAAQAPVLSDFAPYSTVLWHADDFVELMASDHVDDLAAYVDAGGNLWCVGWKLSANLSGATAYPLVFEPGSFLYDYVGVERAELSGMGDSLQAVRGDAGFPDLTVDGSKIPTPAWGPTLRYIEALTPLAGTEIVYRSDMANGGPFDGTACGVRSNGTGPKVAFFAFPLYFMDDMAARQAARLVLTGFGEPLGATSAPIRDRLLLDASPNPFRTRTTLSFTTRHEGKATLAVFDIAGHLVATLMEAQVAPGLHTVTWDGTNAAGAPVGNGIYLCRLEVPGGHAVRRTLLLR